MQRAHSPPVQSQSKQTIANIQDRRMIQNEKEIENMLQDFSSEEDEVSYLNIISENISGANYGSENPTKLKKNIDMNYIHQTLKAIVKSEKKFQHVKSKIDMGDRLP